MFRILIAEDEEPIANLIRMNLTKAGYLCTWAPDGKSAADLMEREKYDLALLDIMLPGINGYELMDYAKACELPVIFLTALGSTEHKVKGLRMGADDYLPKPFPMELLLARVRALLRRREEFTPNILTYGNISLNQQTYILSNGKNAFTLPKLEYQLMELLMLNQGIFLSSEDLLTRAWGYDTEAELGTVWVYISYLRKRLSALDADVTIAMKRNIGYRLEVER